MIRDNSELTFPSLEDTSRLSVLLRSRDPSAGALLNDLFRSSLLRFCRGYLGNVEESEDAVQEICVKILRAPSTPEAIRPWVYKVARNHCLNVARNRGRRRESPGSALDTQWPEALTGQLTRMANDEMRSRLVAMIRALPDEHREVLRLRYVEGLSRAEIAEVLEMPESLVKTRLFESLKKLREQISFLGER